MTKLIFFLSLSLILQSCGTITTHKMLDADSGSDLLITLDEPSSYVYSGTYMDLHLLWRPFGCIIGIEGGEECFGYIMFAPAFLILGAVDLPFSFVADSLLLPHTIGKK